MIFAVTWYLSTVTVDNTFFPFFSGSPEVSFSRVAKRSQGNYLLQWRVMPLTLSWTVFSVPYLKRTTSATHTWPVFHTCVMLNLLTVVHLHLYSSTFVLCKCEYFKLIYFHGKYLVYRKEFIQSFVHLFIHCQL